MASFIDHGYEAPNRRLMINMIGLYFMRILPQNQHKGIGTRIIDMIKTLACEVEADGIFLVCDEKNHTFYKNLGFKAFQTRPTMMHYKLATAGEWARVWFNTEMRLSMNTSLMCLLGK